MTVAHALILARLEPRDQAEVVSQLNQAGKKGAIEFPSVARLQSWVEENIYLSLQDAPFKKEDAALLPEAGACTACPKRTGFNPSLFPEVKKHDSCMLCGICLSIGFIGVWWAWPKRSPASPKGERLG